MKTGLISLVILFTSWSSVLFAQKYANEGTDFWFAYPQLSQDAWATSISTIKFEVHITSNLPSTGTISIDEHVWPNAYPAFSVPYSVVPGKVTTVTLPTGNLYNLNYSFLYAGFNLYSVHVTATSPVAVFASKTKTYQPAATSVMPTSSLGSNYIVTTKPSYGNSTSPGIVPQCGTVVVVAPGSPVTVVVTSPVDIPSDYPVTQYTLRAGVPDTVNIAERGVLHIKTITTGGIDLTGMKIEALNGTDVFAVYSGHAFEKMTGHTADPMFELEYPISTWGNEYIISPAPDSMTSDYRVVAMTDSTQVFVDGTLDTILNEGEFYGDTISGTKVITGSNPIKVTYFMPHRVNYGISTYNPGDNSMCNIVSNDKMYLDSVTFFYFPADLIDSSFVKVITRTADIATVAVNGVIINNWQAVPNLPSYSHSYTKMDTGASVLTTTGCGFLAYVHGFGNYESYNYALGTFPQKDSLITVNITTGNDTLCKNDTIQFSSSSSDSVLSYKWKFGDGDSSDISSPTHVYSTGGAYPISLILNYKCYSDTLLDTLTIQQCCLTDTIGFTYTYPDPCDSSIVEFTATSTGQIDSVEWWMGFPGGAGLTDMTPTVNFPQVKTYNINLWVYGSCGWIDTMIVFTVPSGPTDHYVLNNENINYCQGEPIANLSLTDTSSLGAGGIIDWYSDATLTTNIGSGLTLIPDTGIGNYTYYITETLPCGTRIIDSIFINIYDCYCPNNLVPNSGFETYTSCPQGEVNGDLLFAPPWSPTSSTTDYQNTCYGPPTITPHTGNGNIQIVAYNDWCEYREYAQAPLNQVLVQGKCYQASMYMAFQQGFSTYYVDSIGMLFSAGAPAAGAAGECEPTQSPGFMFPGSGLISASPQITNSSSVDMSSTNWQYVSGTFISNGNENYVTIGNFTPDANLSPTWIGPWPQNIGRDAIYLIDDICLYEIPADTVDVNAIDTVSCSSIALTGPSGYNQYSWYDTSDVLVSTIQSLNVISPGTSTYILYSSDTNACPRTYYRDTVNATIGNTDVINFSYDYPDPCDSTILELTATSTGSIDSIWWSFGFMGGGNPTWNNPIVDFPGDSTFNVNLWIYGSCGWTDITVPVTITVPDPTPNYELVNYNKNYCLGDTMTDISVVDSSGGGGIVNWYSDAAFINNIGTGTTLSPDTALGSYVYFAVETLTCGYRVIDSISITVTTCASCPGNLILNPGFENITGCPIGTTFIEYAVPWNDPPPAPTQANCDLFNNCSPGNLFTVPHTGNGYARFIPYANGSEYREYPQAPLSQPLVAGKCYQSSMYVTLGASSQYTIDSLGIAFTNGAVVQGDPGGTFQPGQGLISASPQVVNDGSVDLSSSDWQLISGQFMAAGGEDYITVGNFTPNANLTPVYIGLLQNHAFYYVDDICLYEMSADTIDAIAISDTTNCDTINLSAPAGYNKYQWEDLTNLNVSSSKDFSISTTGTSTVVLYYADTTSCPLTYYMDTITVTINTAPDAGTDHEIGICTEQTAFNLFDSIPGAPDTGGIWLPILSSGANVFDPLTDAAGIYQYVSGLGGACGTDTAAITVTINATAPPITSDTSICFNDVTAPLVALGDNINWYADPALTGLIFQGDSLFAPDIAVGSYTYWATETDSVTGCESAGDSAVFTIRPIPVPPAASDTSVCFGQTAPDLTAVGSGIQWYNTFSLDSLLGSGANYVTGNTAMGPHEYYVTQTIAGCESSPDSATLTIVPMPTLIISDDIVISAGETTALVVSGAVNYLWSTGAIADNIFVTPQQTTTYTVYGFNGLGCTTEISVTVTVLEEENVVYLPNVFSGNSSNPEHKRLYVFGKGIETLELTIYDRWGEKIYVTTDATSKPRSSDGLCCAYGEGWDGTYMNTGKPLNTAVFVYKLKVTFNNSEEHFENGNITLLK